MNKSWQTVRAGTVYSRLAAKNQQFRIVSFKILESVMSLSFQRRFQRRIELATGDQTRFAAGSIDGDRLKVCPFEGHLQEVFCGDCQPAGSASQRKLHPTDPVIRTINDLGTDQPIGASEVEIEVIRLSFVQYSASDRLGNIVRSQSRADHNNGVGPKRRLQGSEPNTVSLRLQDAMIFVLIQRQ